MQAAIIDVGTRQEHPRAHQFQMQPGGGSTAHLGESGGNDLGRASQFAGAKRRGLRAEAFCLIRCHINEPGRQRIRDRGDNQQVTEPAQQILGEAARILTDLNHLVDAGKDTASITGSEGIHELIEQ